MEYITMWFHKFIYLFFDQNVSKNMILKNYLTNKKKLGELEIVKINKD